MTVNFVYPYIWNAPIVNEAAFPSIPWTTRITTKAKIGDKSKPPNGGIIPLKKFKYGSVIAHKFTSIGLLISRLGNQVSKTLMIKIVE